MTVKDNTGMDGTRSFGSEVLVLCFTNLKVILNMPEVTASLQPADLNGLIESFMAVFGRLPDASNLPYWITQFDNGASLPQLSETFYQTAISPEQSARTGYSSQMSNYAFLQVVYKNVLQQTDVNPTVLSAWKTMLTNQTQTRASVVRAIIADTRRNQGDAAYVSRISLLNNKLAIAKKFAIQEGLFLTGTDSVAPRI